MSTLSEANKQAFEYNKQMREDIKKDIKECYPVKCEGECIILLNDRIYYKTFTFYSFIEFFERIGISDCTYNKKTYEIKEI